jgi:hypothetical protein
LAVPSSLFRPLEFVRADPLTGFWRMNYAVSKRDIAHTFNRIRLLPCGEHCTNACNIVAAAVLFSGFPDAKMGKIR